MLSSSVSFFGEKSEAKNQMMETLHSCSEGIPSFCRAIVKLVVSLSVQHSTILAADSCYLNDSAVRRNSDGEEEIANSNAMGDCVDDIMSNNITSNHDDDDDNRDGNCHENVDMETGVSSI